MKAKPPPNATKIIELCRRTQRRTGPAWMICGMKMKPLATLRPAWISLADLERLLGRIDVLEGLRPQELRALASGALLDRLEARETMAVGPREHSRTMILLLEGRARLYEPGPRGRRLTLSMAEAGTVAGVAGLSARPRGLRVEAVAPSLVCMVRWEAFEEAVERNPEVGLRLSRILADRIGVLEERLAEVAHEEVPTRLAGAILRLVEGEGVVGPEGVRLPTPYTHAQLASMIGANREATTRAMGTLRDRGAVGVRYRRVYVRDLEALRRSAYPAA
jgi:CRP/FNR family transcriptional regulator, cyclic AMP receptor protein